MAGVVSARLREGVRSSTLLESEGAVPEIGNVEDLQRFASDAFFSGHFRTAVLASDRLRQKHPNDPAGWYWAVRANQKLGVAALARAGEVEPDSPRIHALLGDAYQRRSMFDEAREEYSKVLAVSPDSVAGLAGLAKADYADGRLEEAQIAAQKAVARNPADGEINLLMGEILVARREYAKAEPYLEQSLHARGSPAARSRPTGPGVCENRPLEGGVQGIDPGTRQRRGRFGALSACQLVSGSRRLESRGRGV
jgi:tetratricopeptide (TPR) repeat protein